MILQKIQVAAMVDAIESQVEVIWVELVNCWKYMMELQDALSDCGVPAIYPSVYVDN